MIDRAPCSVACAAGGRVSITRATKGMAACQTRSSEQAGRGSPALAAAISATLGVAGTASAQTAGGGLETIIVTATRRAENGCRMFRSRSPRSIRQRSRSAACGRWTTTSSSFPACRWACASRVAPPSCSAASPPRVCSSAACPPPRCISTSSRSRRAAAIPDPRLIDIERLEALRGPQGTLYGASSQSGTLRVITNKADPSGFDAWVDGQVTSIDDGGTGYDVSGMVNVPLIDDRLALRIVGFTAEDAGFHRQRAERQPAGAPLPGDGTFTNADQVDDDVNSRHDERRPRLAALGRQRRRRRDPGCALPGRERRRAR